MLLLFAASVSAASAHTLNRVGLAAHVPARRSAGRSLAPLALYEDDPWMSGTARLPWSSESLECLFRYGPVVYAQRCFDSGEYNASVCKLQDRWKISRALAEQEINMLLCDQLGYLADPGRTKRKPKEDSLLPPVALADKLLVIAWVGVLIPAASFIISQIPEEKGF
uniref:Uncharacterized protein n=1 Tax=Coccolithus braarudii TaxID=221442 RepID=A0A7S0LJI1_9EUKA|mmetsp:Transcript_43778/g.93183  ORF Transcript_43778/g.93183 Transcript_43778/m.93183 type:complete len:167 (+) Transcript_43778:26-526(+)